MSLEANTLNGNNKTGLDGVIKPIRGQSILLSEVAPSLDNILIGLSWDSVQYIGDYTFNTDGSVFLVDKSGVCETENFVFYGNRYSKNKCCVHRDYKVEGEIDDTQILIDLTKVPENIERLVVTATIYQGDTPSKDFGGLSRAFIRLVDTTTDKEFIRYELGEGFSGALSLIVAEIHRQDGEWEFTGISKPVSGGLSELCYKYGVQVYR